MIRSDSITLLLSSYGRWICRAASRLGGLSPGPFPRRLLARLQGRDGQVAPPELGVELVDFATGDLTFAAARTKAVVALAGTLERRWKVLVGKADPALQLGIDEAAPGVLREDRLDFCPRL